MKTIGKYYPHQTAEWLCEHVGNPHRNPMLSKATTYLSDSMKDEIMQRRGP